MEISTGELIRLEGHVYPKQAQCLYLTRTEGVKRPVRLRVFLLQALKRDPRGTVLIAPGRSEFCEKYCEVAEDFRARGFAVLIVDHRGQGLSDRVLKDPLKSYIRSFDDYVQDYAAIVKALKSDLPKPHILMGHSMGGCIGLQGVLTGDLNPDAAVFNAPMLGVVGLEQPFVKTILLILSALGLSQQPIPFQPQKDGIPAVFKGNKLTSDEKRYGRWRAYFDSVPRLRVAGPTYGWIRASVKAMKFIQRNAVNLNMPTLIVSAGSDRIVIPEDVEAFAKRAGADLLKIPEAGHETLLETDAIRAKFFTAFDDFCKKIAI